MERVLTDETIELIATKTMEIIDKEQKDNSLLVSLRKSLKETNKKIQNLMKAIEQGIITNSTKQRLEELEDERSETEYKLTREEIKKPLLSKEHIVYWLNSFKSGNVKSIEYQRRVIDTLVNSVFVYDDDNGGKKIVITFNLSSDNSATITSSDIRYTSPLVCSNPNYIFIVKNVFGIVVTIED